MRRLTATPTLIAVFVLCVGGAIALGALLLYAAPATHVAASLSTPTSPPEASLTVPPSPTSHPTPSPRPTATPRPTAVPRLPLSAPPPPRLGAVALEGLPRHASSTGGRPRATPAAGPRAVATRSPARAGASRPIVYAAIGASDSVGVGADDPATQSWVAVLATRLPRGSTLHNFGISGILLGDALQRELPGAVAANPDLVTVWNAVNDLKAPVQLTTYTQQLDVLLKTLHTRTHAAVFVGNVPALSLLPAFKSVPAATLNAAVAQWNAAIAVVAARYGATLVDLYTPSLDVVNHPEYVSGDGFHPSTTGYRVEADTFWQAILRHKGHLPLP